MVAAGMLFLQPNGLVLTTDTSHFNGRGAAIIADRNPGETETSLRVGSNVMNSQTNIGVYVLSITREGYANE